MRIIKGVVRTVTSWNPRDGYAILRVIPYGKSRPVTVVGKIGAIAVGEVIEAYGLWRNDPSFGWQLKADKVITSAPSTTEGLRIYMAKAFKGVGPVTANLLIEKFGNEVLRVIDEEPERLRGVRGIGPKLFDRIVSSVRSGMAERRIMLFLCEHGVSTTVAFKIFKKYGQRAIDVIRENPYRLALDLKQFGFEEADKVALKIGFSPASPIRIRYGVHHVLAKKERGGHCAYPSRHILADAVAMLGQSETLVEEEIISELSRGHLVKAVVRGTECLYRGKLFRAEQAVAKKLVELSAGRPPWGCGDVQREIRLAEIENGITLDKRQKEAVTTALLSKVTLITGGPGTGKSTITKVILSLLARLGCRTTQCSFTGRAAKRLSEITGKEAATIHRTLGFAPSEHKFSFCADNLIATDFVLVDEATMTSIELFDALISAIPQHAAVLLVGDSDQLPSIDPGRVFADILECGLIRSVRLERVFRQSGKSKIIDAAMQVNQGNAPTVTQEDGSEFRALGAVDAVSCARKIVDVVTKQIPAKYGIPASAVQVLSPEKRGPLGTYDLNRELQAVLNPRRGPEVNCQGFVLRIGDKAMALENDYEKGVFNGDVGRVLRIDREAEECIFDFDGREIVYRFCETDELQLAYACTVHKAQGSEYAAVVIPISGEHRSMWKNLLYTAMTRGAKLVVLVGDLGQLKRIASNVGAGVRWTNLANEIRRFEGLGTLAPLTGNTANEGSPLELQ